MRDDKPPVGFIGLGRMGAPMAGRIAAAGYPLCVYDIKTVALEAFADGVPQASRAASCAEVAEACEVVILMLPDSAAVEQALFGGEGCLAAGLGPGATVIDMGSSNPASTRRLGGSLKEMGVDMIDAPVSGGVKRAVDGTLAVMIGGEKVVIDKVKGLLSVLGRSLIETGGLGSGHAMKALNNYVSAAGLLAACEALRAGVSFGLAAETVVAVLNASTGRNNSTENKLLPYVVSGRYNSGFTVSLMRKDVAIALELIEGMGMETKFGEELMKVWKRAEAQLGTAADHTEIFRLLGVKRR